MSSDVVCITPGHSRQFYSQVRTNENDSVFTCVCVCVYVCMCMLCVRVCATYVGLVKEATDQEKGNVERLRRHI